jgi:hypothetical protein
MFSLTSNSGQAFDIAHLIQIALTPIFLISAIGVILNVLTNRLSWRAARAISTRRSHSSRFLLCSSHWLW